MSDVLNELKQEAENVLHAAEAEVAKIESAVSSAVANVEFDVVSELKKLRVEFDDLLARVAKHNNGSPFKI